jgi:putative FmdB family regulatory protein
MPIFEYICTDCERRFEAVVRASEEPSCPSCAGSKLERQLSSFAVGAAQSAPQPGGGCGRCGDPRGPGACSMN